MKTKFLRFVFALMIALSALGISASVALAVKPEMYDYPVSATVVLTDVCDFDINLAVEATVSETVFFDQNGEVIRWHDHNVEQDTFTANGKTLVGIPFTVNIEFLVDSDGNISHIYTEGIVEKIPLPDGSLFISAGRVDFTNHPGAVFLISPDRGNPGNIEGFCAALAP